MIHYTTHVTLTSDSRNAHIKPALPAGLRPYGAMLLPTPSASGQPLVSALRGKVKRKSSVESKGSDAVLSGEASTPQRSDKAPWPEGTSPMKIAETTNNDSSRANSSTKSDPKDSDLGSKGDSLEKEIGGARRDLF